MGGKLVDPLLKTAADAVDIDEAEIEAAFEPIDARELPKRQETIRSLTKKTAAQAGPLTPVITSPFIGRKGSKMRCTRATRRKLNLQVFISCIIMFTEGFFQTNFFPYGPSMTEVLRGTSADAGTATGLLFTAQSCGMLATAYFWANVSNRFGRRPCLLTGLVANIILTVVMAVTTDYWAMIFFRVVSGAMNSNLSIMRTALRESFRHEDEDDTQAFSTLSVAFGASSVCGPSWGGLIYGTMLPVGGTWQQPWSTALLTCTLLYIPCLVFTLLWMPETAFLDQAPHLQFAAAKTKAKEVVRKRPPPSLLKDSSFLLLLFMGGGHSYVFTGWEIVYPLIARVPTSFGGEGWGTSKVGITFLAGSSFLMLYSLIIYPFLAKRLKVIRIWIYSALPPLLAMFLFPRLVSYLCEHGIDGRSAVVLSLNYGSQAIISMLFGSGFISIQLLLNAYVSSKPNSEELLALANSMLVSTQALVRAVSPIVTGTLFSMGLRAEQSPVLKAFLDRSLPFDTLTVIGALSILLSGLCFERKQAERKPISSPVF